jgi:hypothetical protein
MKLVNFHTFSHIVDYCEVLRIGIFLFIRALNTSVIQQDHMNSVDLYD